MAKAKVKPIHLIKLHYGYECYAVCNCDNISCGITPIDATIKDRPRYWKSKGTFDPTKVTCKRCLKSQDYKDAMDRIKYPLFFLKENK